MKSLVSVVAAVLFLAATVCAQGYEEETVVYSDSRIQAGIRGGLNLTSMSGGLWGFSELITEQLADDPDIDWTGGYKKSGLSGFVFGGFINYKINESFSVQPELLYVKKGVKSHGTANIIFDESFAVTYTLTEKLNLTYLEIPILAKFNIPMEGKVRPSVYAGPALGFKLSGAYEFDAVLTDGSDVLRISGKPDISNMKSTDFGIVLGGDVGLSLGQATLVLDIRYTIGMSGQFGETNFDDIPPWDIDETPGKYPVINRIAETVPDMKNRAVSITAGVKFDL